MDLGLQGKKAVVTGAGRGIGQSIAINLAREGAKVAIISRTKADLIDLMDKIGGEKNGHFFIDCDLVQDEIPSKIFKTLKEEFGDIDILVNNLGGTLNIKDPYCSIIDWRKLWRINMEVAIELNNCVIPYMKEQKWGRIVNISSISSLENHGPVPYCSIKSALTSYSRSMGRVLAPDGIIMTTVLPGAVYVERGHWDNMSVTDPEHVQKYLNERMAIKRFGTLDEIGTVVTFLCSQQASFCVGSMVPVDGGQGRCFF